MRSTVLVRDQRSERIFVPSPVHRTRGPGHVPTGTNSTVQAGFRWSGGPVHGAPPLPLARRLASPVAVSASFPPLRSAQLDRGTTYGVVAASSFGTFSLLRPAGLVPRYSGSAQLLSTARAFPRDGVGRPQATGLASERGPDQRYGVEAWTPSPHQPRFLLVQRSTPAATLSHSPMSLSRPTRKEAEHDGKDLRERPGLRWRLHGGADAQSPVPHSDGKTDIAVRRGAKLVHAAPREAAFLALRKGWASDARAVAADVVAHELPRQVRVEVQRRQPPPAANLSPDAWRHIPDDAVRSIGRRLQEMFRQEALRAGKLR